MEGVVQLSEIHPQGGNFFNPLVQAKAWYGLLTQSEVDDLQKQGTVNLTKAIELIEQRCRIRGDILILRDWAHLDYTGHPFTTPTYSPQLFTELVESFEIIRISTTRDPVTQWQSLTQLSVMQAPLQSGIFDLDQFLVGYRKYAELCVETGFIRYEDFLRKPDIPLRKLCDHLQIKFDPGFMKRWTDYNTITGDINNPRGSDKIKKPPRQPVEPALRKKFLGNADYLRSCKLLGYDVLGK
jgi:hypothetical protein